MKDNVQVTGKTIIGSVGYSYEDVVISINEVIYDGGTVDNIIPISEATDEVSEDVHQSQ